ncbi:MAG: NAD-dependent epimerase/dehydratase family protein [Deinococcaceae bacterium]
MNVLVTGATGFVGKSIVAELARLGHRVYAGSRLGSTLPDVQAVTLDVTKPDSIDQALSVAQPEAVVHLVGIIAEKGTQTFESVHVQGTEHLIQRLQPNTRYVHMSALGARLGTPSRYFTSKAQAEQRVRDSHLAYTIFRPSLIFGPGDDFFGRVLRNLVSQGPIVPLIGRGNFPFRPVSIHDVTKAFVGTLSQPESVAKTFDLVGPTEYSLKQLLQLELQTLGKRKPLMSIPLAFMNILVPLMNLVPNPPITRDQYAMLLEGNTGDPSPAREVFDLPMETLENALPNILKKH